MDVTTAVKKMYPNDDHSGIPTYYGGRPARRNENLSQTGGTTTGSITGPAATGYSTCN